MKKKASKSSAKKSTTKRKPVAKKRTTKKKTLAGTAKKRPNAWQKFVKGKLAAYIKKHGTLAKAMKALSADYKKSKPAKKK